SLAVARSRFGGPRAVPCQLWGGARRPQGEPLRCGWPRQLLHMVKAMGKAADPQGQRAHLDDQIVQLALRHMSADHVPAEPIRLGVITEDLTAPAGDQPLNPRGKGVGHRYLDQVDRLAEERATPW